jgi:hypothetical protein
MYHILNTDALLINSVQPPLNLYSMAIFLLYLTAVIWILSASPRNVTAPQCQTSRRNFTKHFILSFTVYFVE